MDFVSDSDSGLDSAAGRWADSREVMRGVSFSPKDLALCSSEEARSFLSCTEATRLRALPLAVVRGPSGVGVHLAVDDESPEALGRIRFACGVTVDVTKVPSAILEEAIQIAYLGSDARLQRYIERVARAPNPPRSERELPRPIPQGDAAQFITALLEFAAVRGASDLHLAPIAEGALIKMRVDGELLSQESAPYARVFHEQVVSRLKVLASLDIASKQVPQDGAFSFALGNLQRHARLSVLPTIHGESVVIRFQLAKSIPQVSSLGMEPRGLGALRGAMARTEGLILLTGPTGSGKTTTMYGVVQELGGRGRNVVTVEDPVEVPIHGMVQVQVALARGLDYPRAIRSVLRHDPDVLLIGEMRDAVSASMALDAASTGHLTVSSLHVGSALHAVQRLDVLGIPAVRSVPAIALIVNQRLIPKLCVTCKEQAPAPSAARHTTIYRRVGCQRCQESGYQGRVLVTEIVDLQSQQAKDACYRAGSPHQLMELLPKGAFLPWTESLQYHLSRGDISMEQVEDFIAREFE